MYAGELMEEAPAADLWRQGRHPYTQMLFASATSSTPTGASSDAPAAAANPPARPAASPVPSTGIDAPTATVNVPTVRCAFAPRCPQAAERCFHEKPPLREIAPGHSVRCHLE
jgi:oligopeptide/dipeptide ABC transporter ATP-binding protein